MLWGIDLGGTKIEVAVLENVSPDSVVFRHRIDTQADQGAEHIARRIGELVNIAAKEVGMRPEKIGIGTPGAIDPPTGLFKNSNTTCLNGIPFHRMIQDVLQLPVSIANDANCFALAEARMGVIPEVMPDAKVVFGVIMGTGVGGGIVVNGQPLNGRHGIGGEWGHIFLDESGGPCYCGSTGCVERVISGTALQRFYSEDSGKDRKLKQIVARAGTGKDASADRTMDRLVKFFGKGISYIINILDPDAIVLGGGVGNVDLLYTEGVREAAKWTFNPQLTTPFFKPRLGDSAGVFGAALLVA